MCRVIFIIPYFGRFPNYFQLVLNSIKQNMDFNWLIFTDNNEKYDYPKNVEVIKIGFDELKEKIQKKFDFKISLEKPYKLCDFKPTYGYVFEEYIKNYDFWGYCDIDVIFGKLSHFITEELLSKYEKIFLYGHMTLYKITRKNNMRFMKSYKQELLYKKYLSSPKNYAFDEVWNGSINDIYRELGIDIYEVKLCADILPEEADFRLSLWHNREYLFEFKEKKRVSLFTYENGEINRYFIKDYNMEKLEYMYIHLQKRKMKVNRSVLSSQNFMIIPNKFKVLNENITNENYKKLSKRQIDSYYLLSLFNEKKIKIKRETIILLSMICPNIFKRYIKIIRIKINEK